MKPEQPPDSTSLTEPDPTLVALRQEAEAFKALVEHSPILIARFDRQLRHLDVNPSICRVAGLSRSDFLGKTNQELGMPSAQVAYWDEVLLKVFKTGQAQPISFEFEGPAGQRSYKGRVIPVPTIDGTAVDSVISFIQDLTDHMQVEVALGDSERRYRHLVEALPTALYTTDAAGYITFYNQAAVELWGREPRLGYEKWCGSLQLYTLDGEPLRHDQSPMARAITENRPIHGQVLAVKRPDDSRVILMVHPTPMHDASGNLIGAVNVFVDITALKEAKAAQAKLEEELRQANKMESVGRLAGGVAHDFNNLLTVIQGYSELIQNRLTPDDPLQRAAEQIQGAAESAAALIRQLLAFSRKQILAPVILNLNDLVDNLRPMLPHLIGEDILLETRLSPDLRLVLADPGQLEQVLLNLAVNARDAMPTGGRLIIETTNVDLDQVYLSPHLEAPLGPAVMLTVTDTGQGMDKKTQSQIFEPFFTTKAVGQGTGLGLATVHGIVKQSGGDIHIYSEPGQGATFKIYLPAAETTPEALSPMQAAPKVGGGHETILLVEDEAMVRRLVLKILEERGYNLLEARRGEEALALALAHSGQIDLLITDVVMPEMSGRVLAEQLVVLRPGLKVLYISGYTNDEVVGRGLLTAEVEFLSKPFSPTALAVKVRQVLDGRVLSAKQTNKE